MKYFFGFIASIALIVVVFILVLRGFSGGGDGKAAQVTKLTSYADTAAVMRFTVDGPINAAQEHNAYQITVGRDEVIIDIFQGYDQNLIDSRTYENTEAGYKQFLGALEKAGYNKGIKPEKPTSPVGACATDKRVTLEIVRGSSTIQNFWSTSCKEKGTFRGDIGLVAQLFRAQVPEYSALTRKLNL